MGEHLEDTLRTLYWEEELSEKKIADRLDVSDQTIHRWMVRLGIPRRSLSEAHKGQIPWNKGIKTTPLSKEHRRKISEAMMGKQHSEESLRKMRETACGRKPSKETRKKISEAMSGSNNHNYGKQRSEETRRKISEANKGKNHPFYGKHLSKEHRRNISEGNKGKTISEETRKKLSEANKGQVPWIKGKHLSEETRKKISETKIGDKNPNWNGGSSFEPYPLEFNERLKREIRERDNYTCLLCGEPGIQVHHIDYDKENNNPSNLIALCNPCHGKTNTDRVKWTVYFMQLQTLVEVIQLG